MAAKLSEWFSLREGRTSFLPRIPDDAHLVFCHNEQIEKKIIPAIEQAFATEDPIKMLIYGDWGVGKTHLLHHIGWWLKERESTFPAFPVIIEIGDIARGSRFSEIVRPLLDRLSLDFVVKLVHDFRGLEPSVSDFLRSMGISAHIGEAFNKFLLSSPGQPPVDMMRHTFDYLKGNKISGQAATGLGQPIVQSKDFVDILIAVGEMYRRVHEGTRIVFIADEGARLEGVEVDDAIASHWLNANKLIFDDSNQSFGFIYTVSGTVGPAGLPKAIWEPQIQNRIGQNHFEMMPLATPDVDSYLTNLFNAFIDFQEIERLVNEGVIPKGDYNRDSYPFTTDAKSRFKDFFGASPEDSKPRDLSRRLNDLGFLALKNEQRVITIDLLEASEM